MGRFPHRDFFVSEDELNRPSFTVRCLSVCIVLFSLLSYEFSSSQLTSSDPSVCSHKRHI